MSGLYSSFLIICLVFVRRLLVVFVVAFNSMFNSSPLLCYHGISAIKDTLQTTTFTAIEYNVMSFLMKKTLCECTPYSSTPFVDKRLYFRTM